MFVERVERYKQTTKRKYKRNFFIYRCDQCGSIFERQGKPCTGNLHFCGKQCMLDSQRAGGKLDQAKRVTFLDRYGVENPSQSDSVKEKKITTTMLHYGVPFPSQSEEVKQKIVATNLERHGHVCNLHGESSQKKIGKMLAAVGVKNIAQRPDVLEKIKQTMLAKYGSERVGSSEIIKAKIKETIKNRYGVKSAFCIPSIRQSASSQQAAQRRHETMKRNGTYRTSKPEDLLFILLCENFGAENVERNVPISGTRWSIDFHIKHIDVYIQLDGIYWHGLDRPIEIIAEHKNKRDVVIHKKWLTDRQQDAWFREKNLTLLRVTENFDFSALSDILDSYDKQRILPQ